MLGSSLSVTRLSAEIASSSVLYVRSWHFSNDIQEVVLATHQVLPYIKNFENKEKWQVFIDEALQVVRYDKHEIPQTHDLMTRYLSVRSVNSVYGRVDVIDRDAVEEIAKNEDEDEILET
jgi:hypothetical protein